MHSRSKRRMDTVQIIRASDTIRIRIHWHHWEPPPRAIRFYSLLGTTSLPLDSEYVRMTPSCIEIATSIPSRVYSCSRGVSDQKANSRGYMHMRKVKRTLPITSPLPLPERGEVVCRHTGALSVRYSGSEKSARTT